MRAADPKLLTVFAGDLFGPSMMSGVTKGRHMVNVLNLLGIDYGCFGNHEFDFGMKGLNKVLHSAIDRYGMKTKPSKTTWLSTNIDGSDGKPIGGAKKMELVDWHGVKVGLISVSENWLPGCNKLKAGDAKWLDDVAEATAACKELRSQGAEVVLLISHSGIDADRKFMSAMPVELLDLCCGGHDHDYIRDEMHRVVKAGQEWRYLVDIEFELPPEGEKGPAKLIKCEQVPITEAIAPDPEIGDVVSNWTAMIEKKASKVLGKTAVDLNSTKAFLRWHEGELSNWVCDVVAEDHSANEGAQAADFAMLMGVTIAGKRIDPAGDITYGCLLAWLPKVVNIVVLKLTGEQVVKSLERGCGSLPGECGSIHHTSAALTYTIDLAVDKGEGRAKDVMVNGSPIEMEKVYTVACSEAMSLGKYGYDWMGTADRVVDAEFATPLFDLLRDWLKKHKGKTIQPPGEGTRIQIINSPPAE